MSAGTPWALGDYHSFALATVWEVGPVLVKACGIGPGDRVLDVAAGTGNTAIRAAQAGATVVASDITPQNFEAGRREAARHGVEVAWVEADAQSLPFDDDSFDVVASSFGAIFAPDHRAVADELLRVCRPGGTVGMANFTPTQLGEFFGVLAPYTSPPEGPPPGLWGTEGHLAELFGDRVAELTITPGTYVERADGPEGYRELFKTTFGPVVAVYEALADDPARRERLDADFLDFARRANRGAPGGPAEYPYDYVVVIARAHPA